MLFGFSPNHKGNLVYVPSTRKIVSSHDVVFGESFLVREHTNHIRIQRHFLCNHQSNILRMIHHLMNKLETL